MRVEDNVASNKQVLTTFVEFEFIEEVSNFVNQCLIVNKDWLLTYYFQCIITLTKFNVDSFSQPDPKTLNKLIINIDNQII